MRPQPSHRADNQKGRARRHLGDSSDSHTCGPSMLRTQSVKELPDMLVWQVCRGRCSTRPAGPKSCALCGVFWKVDFHSLRIALSSEGHSNGAVWRGHLLSPEARAPPPRPVKSAWRLPTRQLPSRLGVAPGAAVLLQNPLSCAQLPAAFADILASVPAPGGLFPQGCRSPRHWKLGDGDISRPFSLSPPPPELCHQQCHPVLSFLTPKPYWL